MEIVRLTDDNFSRVVKRASEVLKRGGIVLYPTDTLYGLAVDAKNRPALAELRELKGREKKKPISVVLPDAESLEAYAQVHPSARYYAKRFLPGALTLVLPGNESLPEELMLNGEIGIRIPDDPFVLSLASVFGPFTATSANRAGFPTPTDVENILAQFGPHLHRIALAIDAGSRDGGVGSTVLTFRDGEPFILREGALSRRDLGL